MPSKLRSRSTLAGQLFIAAALIAVFLPTAANAGTCHMSGQGNSFTAYTVNAGQYGVYGVPWSMSVPLDTSGLGPGGKSDYYGAHGLYALDSNGRLEFYYLTIHDGISPRVVITNGSQTVVDETGVTETQLGFGSEHYVDPFAIGPGINYVVGFSFGSDSYVAEVNLPCVTATPPSTLVQKDQTDFTAIGSLPNHGQIYTPGFGVGNNLKLSLPNPRRFFVGYLSEYVPVGHVRMSFSTPAPGVITTPPQGPPQQNGTLTSPDDRLAVWGTGSANFILNYYGVLPNVHVDGWELDL